MWHDVTSCGLLGRSRQSNQQPRRDGHKMLKIRASAFPSNRASSEKKKRTFDSALYQCTDDCACTDPSICNIRPSFHPCIQLAKGKQTDIWTYAPRATWIDVNCLNCIELHWNVFFKFIKSILMNSRMAVWAPGIEVSTSFKIILSTTCQVSGCLKNLICLLNICVYLRILSVRSCLSGSGFGAFACQKV